MKGVWRFLFCLGFTLSALARGAEVGAAGIVVREPCEAPERLVGTFNVVYRYYLPPGGRVVLMYALGGYRHFQSEQKASVIWQEPSEAEMRPGSRGTWSVPIKKILHRRGSPHIYTELEFLFRLIWPNGEVRYDNGFRGYRGYYSVHANKPSGCLVGTRARQNAQKVMPLHRTATERYPYWP